jgi:hypothetical protein
MHNIHLLLQINVPKDKIKNYKYALKLTKRTMRVIEKKDNKTFSAITKSIKTIYKPKNYTRHVIIKT